MSDAYVTILKELPGCTATELKKLIESCDSLYRQVVAGKSDVHSKQILMHSVLEDVVKGITGCNIPRYTAFMHTKDGKQLVPALDAVTALSMESKKRLSKTEHRRAIVICTKAIVSRLQDNGGAIRASTILARLKDVKIHFAIAFPGYIESGLCDMIFKAQRGKQ